MQLPAEQIGDGHVLRTGEAGRVQRGVEGLLDVQHVRPDRKPGHVVVQQPGVVVVDPPGRPHPLLGPGPPAECGVGQAVVGVHPVDHQLDQLRAPRHVGVDRHRADAEPSGDLADRERLHALGVGDGHPGVHHLGQAGTRSRATSGRRRMRVPQALDRPATLGRADLDRGRRRLGDQPHSCAQSLSIGKVSELAGILYLRTVYAVSIRYSVRELRGRMGNDPYGAADQALREQEGDRRGGQGRRHRRRPGRAGGLPRSQRRGQVDHAADADHPAAADLGPGLGGRREHRRRAGAGAVADRLHRPGQRRRTQLPGPGRAGHAGQVLRDGLGRRGRSGQRADGDAGPDRAGQAGGEHACPAGSGGGSTSRSG